MRETGSHKPEDVGSRAHACCPAAAEAVFRMSSESLQIPMWVLEVLGLEFTMDVGFCELPSSA